MIEEKRFISYGLEEWGQSCELEALSPNPDSTRNSLWPLETQFLLFCKMGIIHTGLQNRSLLTQKSAFILK